MKKLSMQIGREIGRISTAWGESKAGTFGASVAYYTIFSIAPLLIISVAIAGLVFDKASARAGIIHEFSGAFGQGGATFADTLINSSVPKSGNILLIIFGFIVIFLGATGIFSQLEAALDSIFESSHRHSSGIWKVIKHKLLSLGMIMSVGFLLMASLAISAVVSALSEWLSDIIPGGDVLASVADVAVSFLLISFFLALIYRFLPSKKIGLVPSLIGGVIAGVFFTLGKYALGIYLGSSNSLSAYGSAAALVLIIVWTYYMSQIFFLSAIIVKLYVLPRKQ